MTDWARFLGGPDVPGIGFGVGMERLIACLPPAGEVSSSADIFIAALGERAQKIAFTLTQELRRRGICAAMDYSGKSLKSQMKRADKLNSAYTLIFGDREIEENCVELRDMNSKNQQRLPLDHLLEAVTDLLKAR